MRITALAIVTLVVGILTGFVLRDMVLDAEAKPKEQKREDQVVIFSQPNLGAGPSIERKNRVWAELEDYVPVGLVLNPADYPSSASFSFQAVWFAAPRATSCLRLFDTTTNTVVEGSEVCHTNPAEHPGSELVRVRSAPFVVPFGEHEYTVQGKCGNLNPDPAFWCSVPAVGDTRIIVEWTERVRGPR